MPNYKNSKIYKLVSNQTTDIYIGSTAQALGVRKAGHTRDYKSWAKEKHNYMTSFEICKHDDFKIILLENCPCDSKEQLQARERYYIETLECVNKNIPTRSVKEYYQANKCEILEQRKEYYEQNKNVIQQRNKEYYEDNKTLIQKKQSQRFQCVCGSNVCIGNKATHNKSIKHNDFIAMFNFVKHSDPLFMKP
ncbi:GIY-YIG nuclease family protein [Clostridium sp.]|uniref:GIY-YIG nuclease family protein n=1 Tax=Clostridium sp. TaxID=1506 RepID=UPI00284507E3|nr:GIY-YIG nuclease family protein [Clostridium sp.]MDR3593505.1 GIY-YIG nuclease family protein [Clostridium sp.]